MLWVETFWKDWPTKTVLTVCFINRPIRYVELVWNREKYVLRAHRTVRNEEDKTLFSLGRSTDSSVVGLLPDQLAQPEGTVNAQLLTFTKSKFRNDRPGAVLRLDLGLQRLPRPSWGRESASRKRGKVSSSVFVTLGRCKGAATSLIPRVSLSPSSSVSVFGCLRLRLPLSSSLWGAVSCKGAATSLVPRVGLSSSAACPMFYIEGLDTTVVCAF